MTSSLRSIFFPFRIQLFNGELSFVYGLSYWLVTLFYTRALKDTNGVLSLLNSLLRLQICVYLYGGVVFVGNLPSELH